MNQANKLYEKFTDTYGFIVPLIIQVAMVTLSLIGISLNWLLAVGYSGLGFGAVIYAPRAFKNGMISVYKKEVFNSIRYFLNWILFAGVSIFIGLSFTLAGTTTQSDVSEIVVTLVNDPAYLSAVADKQSAEVTRDALIAEEQATSGRQELAAIHERQANNDAELIRLQRKVEDRRDEILSGEATRKARELVNDTGSNTVFYAIPDAADRGDYIPLIFWASLIVGTELMIINSMIIEAKEHKRPQGTFYEEVDKHDQISAETPELTASDFAGEDYEDITPEDIRNYANVRYDSESWDQPLLRPHQSIEALVSLGVSEEKYKRITDKALEKDLFRIREMDTYPAPFISRETFISQVQEEV